MSAQQTHVKSVSLVVGRPPKPPCWRDFLPETCKSNVISVNHSVRQTISDSTNQKITAKKSSSVRQFTDLNLANSVNKEKHPSVNISISDGKTIVKYKADDTQSVHSKQTSKAIVRYKADDTQSVHSKQTSKSSRVRTLKRSKNKLRRTQSQATIDTSDLPCVEDLTISLAETNPQDFGLRRSSPFDARVYLNANMKRCEEWVEDVRAARTSPLVMSDIEFGQGSGDELEIPEETWHDFKNLKSYHSKKKGHKHNGKLTNDIQKIYDLDYKHQCKLKSS